MSTPDENEPELRTRPAWKLPPFLRWLFALILIALSWALTYAIILPTPAVSAEGSEGYPVADVVIGGIVIVLRVVSLWLGIRAGAYLVGLQEHPTRKSFWSPVGSALLAGILIFAVNGFNGWAVPMLASLTLPLITAPVRSYGEVMFPDGLDLTPAERFVKKYEEGIVGTLTLSLSGLAFIWAAERQNPWPTIILAALAGGNAVVTLWLYRRPCFEQLVVTLTWPLYRVRAVGPGLERFPRTGPLLVIANHTAYLDPVWVMQLLPRDLTAMAHSFYYRWRAFHWFMAHILNVIPVGGEGYRREPTELAEAVRRLDRGEALLVFPEGWVRRKADEPLRRFAQGPGLILRERPATPVVACWIEGGWGSLTSFRDGPPFRNKRLDWRRPIIVAVAAPVVLDPDVLADPRRTREVLREMCLGARALLDLPPLE